MYFKILLLIFVSSVSFVLGKLYGESNLSVIKDTPIEQSSSHTKIECNCKSNEKTNINQKPVTDNSAIHDSSSPVANQATSNSNISDSSFSQSEKNYRQLLTEEVNVYLPSDYFSAVSHAPTVFYEELLTIQNMSELSERSIQAEQGIWDVINSYQSKMDILESDVFCSAAGCKILIKYKADIEFSFNFSREVKEFKSTTMTGFSTTDDGVNTLVEIYNFR